MVRDENTVRQDICIIGRRLWERGYVAANDGNISVRIGPDAILATPTGVSKGFLTPDQIVKVDMEGKQLDGYLKPSSEVLLHIALYKARCDVCAVVHAHPPYATAFAVAGLPLESPILPEAIISLGGVPLARYGLPGTWELPETIMPYVEKHDAFLMANHGAVTVGADVYQAYYRMETMEHYAFILFLARQLGGEQELPPERVQELLLLRKQMGLDFPRECIPCTVINAPRESAMPVYTSPPPAPGRGNGRSRQDLERMVREVVERVINQMYPEGS